MKNSKTLKMVVDHTDCDCVTDVLYPSRIPADGRTGDFSFDDTGGDRRDDIRTKRGSHLRSRIWADQFLAVLWDESVWNGAAWY